MRVAFIVGALLASASFARAKMDYDQCVAHCIANNQPMLVLVGKCSNVEGAVRANWLKDFGYEDGPAWFAPSGGKMYYVGKEKPKLAYTTCDASGKCSPSYFPSSSVSACSTGSCGTATIRSFRIVQSSGSCATGNCGR